MTLIRLTRDLMVNREHIASVHWRRNYSDSTLVITMCDGSIHNVQHNPYALDGTDCYEIEKKLLETV